MTKPFRIFISYAREDAEAARRLVSELRVLEGMGHVTLWQDIDLRGGEAFGPEIERQIAASDIFMPLISKSFLRSAYCRKEMALTQKQSKAKKCRIIPTLISPSKGWEKRKLGKKAIGTLQTLPSNAQPISEWPNIDHAWQTVASEMADIVLDRFATSQITKANVLAQLGSFAMEAIAWRFEIEEWQHGYPEDADSERELYGRVETQRRTNRLNLTGYNFDYTRIETVAVIEYLPAISELHYRIVAPDLGTQFRYGLKFSRLETILAVRTYAAKGAAVAPPELGLTDFIEFLVQTFRRQKVLHRPLRRRTRKPSKRKPRK